MCVHPIAAALAVASFAVCGQAQLDDASSPAANPAIVPTSLTLRDGTAIRLRLDRDLAFTNVKPGDMVDFVVLDDLRIDGLLVMAHGARATATITQAEPKTRMGRGGKLGVKLETVPLLNGGKVSMRVTSEVPAGSRSGAAGAAESAEIVKPAAPSLLFTYGKDETFPEGSKITVYTDGDLKLDPAQFLVDVSFTSNPPGAMVSLYGAPLGRTPLTTRLAPGSYKATFSANGYYDLTESVPVGPGYSSTVHAAFELKP